MTRCLVLLVLALSVSACSGSMQRSQVADLQAFEFFHCEGRGLRAVFSQGVYRCVTQGIR